MSWILSLFLLSSLGSDLALEFDDLLSFSRDAGSRFDEGLPQSMSSFSESSSLKLLLSSFLSPLTASVSKFLDRVSSLLFFNSSTGVSSIAKFRIHMSSL